MNIACNSLRLSKKQYLAGRLLRKFDAVARPYLTVRCKVIKIVFKIVVVAKTPFLTEKSKGSLNNFIGRCAFRKTMHIGSFVRQIECREGFIFHDE